MWQIVYELKEEHIRISNFYELSCSTLTSVNWGFTLGGLPLGLPVEEGAVDDATPDLATFFGLPLGLPLDTLALGGFGGALGSFGGRPLGLGGDKTVPGGRGALGFGGLPRPLLGGAFGSRFM